MKKTIRILTRVAFLVGALVAALVVAAQPAAAAPARPTKVATKASTASPYTSGTTGYDVSWPNCSAKPPKHPTFDIVGVSDGTGYSQNPCLAQEAAWFPSANLSLVVNTGWYDQSTHINPSSPHVCATGDEDCLAYNYGYNAGLYALSYTSSQNVQASTWWLDVETSNTWNADTMQNRNSLQGEFDALTANGVAIVGVYSTTAQWDSVTGTWHNNWPNWGATTVRTASEAATFCTGHQFTGGPTYLIQYTGTLDRDYAC